MKAAGPLVKRAKYFLSYENPDARHGYLGGNHQLRTHGLFAIVPLALSV